MLYRIYLLVVPLILFSCGVEDDLENVISKTWDLKWKKCGFYQSSLNAQIKFNITDSINDGWYSEAGDTSFFNFEIIDNETILLDSASNVDWSDVLNVRKYSSSILELERSNKQCENELFSFE
jgi:hypothetical protein